MVTTEADATHLDGAALPELRFKHLSRPASAAAHSISLAKASTTWRNCQLPKSNVRPSNSSPTIQSSPMPHWPARLGITRAALINSVRASVAVVASMLLARSLKLPEFYWAPISTLVILLSTIDPLTLAWQRFAGTALGAALGALIGSYWHPSWIVYGLGIFVCGIFSALLRIGNAYRFTAITLTIVLLIAHTRPAWIVATHRFIEVSLGIAVALMVTMVWPAPAAGTD